MGEIVHVNAVTADISIFPFPFLSTFPFPPPPATSISNTSGPLKSTTIKFPSFDAAKNPTLLSARQVVRDGAPPLTENLKAATGRKPSRSGRETTAPRRSM
jgi:hypothetical protein